MPRKPRKQRRQFPPKTDADREQKMPYEVPGQVKLYPESTLTAGAKQKNIFFRR